MNKIHFLLLIAALPFASCYAQQKDTHFEPVAIVELFTSEGCSSCPPADKVLSKIKAEAERDHKKIFPLSFHVDYWDRLGWKDPFSSRLYSERQRQYVDAMNLNGAYTPQMVVNGKYEFAGYDEAKLNDALTKALRVNTPASFSKLNVTAKDGGKLVVDYELKGNYTGCEIHFAIVSKQESTAVKRGENSGRQLTHINVVRQFLTTTAKAQGEVIFDTVANSLLIAYVQHAGDLQIIAAAEAQP